MNAKLVGQFCTPPINPLTEYDGKVLADAERISIPYRDSNLNGFCWGKGKTILLVHGWGSRASHLAPIGRLLSKSNFRVVAYDAPAHFSLSGYNGKSTSNMFDYCYTLSAVANTLGPIYAIVGHSFGAFCGALITSGRLVFTDYQISPEKFICLSTPPTLTDILKSFCKHNNLDSSGFYELKESLEKTFSFSVDDYNIVDALRSIAGKTLLIHDTNDEEFSVDDIYSIKESLPHLQLFTTSGSGHQKILINRTVIAQIIKYLSETN